MIIDTSSTGNIQVETSFPIEGLNRKQFFTKFANTSEIQFDDVFVEGGSTIRGAWTTDGGDLSLPAGTSERRYFCIKGKATFTFTGTSVAIRTSLNTGWGTATIRIDGVSPSTISGVTRPADTISCNATTLGSAGNIYIDQVVADSLSPGTHTLEIICANSGVAFFVLSGIKTFNVSLDTIETSLWSINWNDRPQDFDLTFKMPGATSIIDLEVNFDSNFLDAAGSPMGIKTAPLIGEITTAQYNVRLNTSSASPLLEKNASIGVTYLVPSTTGIERESTNTLNFLNPRITYGGTWYNIPASSIPEDVYNSGNKAAWMLFPGGDNMSIRCWLDYGIGAGLVMKDAVAVTGCTIPSSSTTITVPNTSGLTVGMNIAHNRFAINVTITDISGTTVTLSAASTGATNNTPIAFGNYVQEINTATVGALEQTFQSLALTGIPSGYTGNVLIQCKNTKSFSFTSVTLDETKFYEEVTQTISIDATLKQVGPSPVTTASLTDGRVVYTAPDPNSANLLSDTPFDNTKVDRLEVEYRFPTFVVCYSSGFFELFKQYDIVITDPAALSRGEVAELQELGIQVYMYVSFGEEDGAMLNVWDEFGGQGPHVGNGLGPGGFAGYYMKGGYNYGEFSECEHDRQRLEGVKACALSNPKYYSSLGRCGSACNKDWKEGYEAWSTGGVCGGGYTSSNNWERDASTACSNGSCPNYTPTNSKCSQYEQASDVWGQDFSISSPTKPDENGIWKSYYVNAVDRGAGSWYDKLDNFYLPLIFDLPEAKVEELTIASHVTSGGSVLGVKVSSAIEDTLPFSVVDKATSFEYLKNVDYSLNKMTGTIILTPDAESSVPGYVLPTVGQVLTVSFSSRGLGADGVFMDTVDTVDVYPDETYKQGFADLINDLKLSHPSKKFCSNRGFGIYDKMIQSCSLIMTESVFSDYNFNTGTYQEVSPEAALYNEEVTRMIQELRLSHTFDVVCLNYAPNGPTGDAIRESVREKTLALGWMPWISTVLLNEPLSNTEFAFTKGYIRSNKWNKTRVINIRPV